jgi:hypothetical protein
MARADERQSQASCFRDNGSQALEKESSRVGLGYLLLNIATLLLLGLDLDNLNHNLKMLEISADR